MTAAMDQRTPTCETCEGSGEVTVPGTVERSEFGVWDRDTTVCADCGGRGCAEWVRCEAIECGTWFDPDDGTSCAHGEPLCEDHRGQCTECCLDAMADGA